MNQLALTQAIYPKPDFALFTGETQHVITSGCHLDLDAMAKELKGHKKKPGAVEPVPATVSTIAKMLHDRLEKDRIQLQQGAELSKIIANGLQRCELFIPSSVESHEARAGFEVFYRSLLLSLDKKVHESKQTRLPKAEQTDFAQKRLAEHRQGIEAAIEKLNAARSHHQPIDSAEVAEAISTAILSQQQGISR